MPRELARELADAILKRVGWCNSRKWWLMTDGSPLWVENMFSHIIRGKFKNILGVSFISPNSWCFFTPNAHVQVDGRELSLIKGRKQSGSLVGQET